MLNRYAFELLSYLERKGGAAGSIREISDDLCISGTAVMKSLEAAVASRYAVRETGGYRITERGLQALEPYRVSNAVILAAGPGTRFIPLSLERPKGLWEVRGEKLIERLIRQLKEAGVEDITVVAGCRGEMLAYLREKVGVKLLHNPLYNMKDNIESLRLAGEALGNTYICASDCYYTENPFGRYEFQPFCAVCSGDREGGPYVRTDADGRITGVTDDPAGGSAPLGHSYWTVGFSAAFRELMEEDRETGAYDGQSWERMAMDNLPKLPPFYAREYEPGAMYGFDRFEQLRAFDPAYIGSAHSEIIRNIKLVFHCDEEDIGGFRPISEGLANTSFVFRVDGADYIYRHPGDGTESIINRRNEKRSLIKAREFGVDPTYYYMDVNEGWKISKFVSGFRMPDYGDFGDSERILAVLRRLHSLPVKADYGLSPWEDALVIERMLKAKDPRCFEGHEALKAKVGELYERTVGDGVEKCFCHGDTYRPNWMIEPDGRVILIDWEYAGFSDPGVDVGYYIADAMYDFGEARRFIRAYLGDGWTERKEFHHMAYTALIAYYWFVWAMYRESCGANMGDALPNWRRMAEKYADYMLA